MSGAPLRVIVADDDPVARADLVAPLSGDTGLVVVAEVADGREACAATRALRPDVVLLNARMPVLDGLEALPHLVPFAVVLMVTRGGDPDTVREALRRGATGYLLHGEFDGAQLVAAVRGARDGAAHFTPTAARALLAHLRHAESSASATAHADVGTERRGVGNMTDPLSQLQLSVGQSSARGREDRERFRLSAREAEIMDLIASGMTNRQIASLCFISEKTVKNHVNRIFAKLHSTSRTEAAARWLGTAPDSHFGGAR
ncbi:response regulator transcription factor [Streptomyces sp. ZYX-F-203]